MTNLVTISRTALTFFDRVSWAADKLNATGIASYRDDGYGDCEVTTRPLGRVHCQYALDLRYRHPKADENGQSITGMNLSQARLLRDDQEFCVTVPVAAEATALLHFAIDIKPVLKGRLFRQNTEGHLALLYKQYGT